MSKPFHEIYSSSQGMILNGEPVDQEGKKRKPIKEHRPRKKGRWKRNIGWIVIGLLLLAIFVPLPQPFHRRMKFQYLNTLEPKLLQSSELEMKGWVFHYAFKPDRFSMHLRERVMTGDDMMDSGWVRMKGTLAYEEFNYSLPEGMINFRFDTVPEAFSPMFQEFFNNYFTPVTQGSFQWILARSQSSFAVGPAENLDDATEQILEYISRCP